MPGDGRQREAGGPNSIAGMLRVLIEHGVDFVVCGGVACIMHGVNRTTTDIDVAVRLSDDNLRRLISAACELGLQPRIPEPVEALLDARRRQEWIDQKKAVVYTLVSPRHPRQLDMFLQYPIEFDDLKKRANEMKGDDVTVLVSAKTDLIAAKRIAGREQDKRDIQDLERIVRDEQARAPQGR